jgi:hypothetical protein
MGWSSAMASDAVTKYALLNWGTIFLERHLKNFYEGRRVSFF